MAGSLAVVFILVVPPVVGLLREDASRAVPGSQRVASQVDVLLVAARPYRGTLPDLSADSGGGGLLTPYAHAAELDIRYVVGFAAGDGDPLDRDGHGRRTAPRSRPSPAHRPRTPRRRSRGPGPTWRWSSSSIRCRPPWRSPGPLTTPARQPGEVRRWRRIARAAARPGTAAFALLRTRDERQARGVARLRAPARVLASSGSTARPSTDAAVRLAVAAPTAQEDFLLALRHRPVLLFDDREPVPRPLRSGRCSTRGKVRLCRDARPGADAL